MPCMVQRAYLFDNVYPFEKPRLLRVLLDKYGNALIRGHGWVSRSVLGSYRIVNVGKPCQMWSLLIEDDHKWWGRFWVESESWSWLYFKEDPHFVPCDVQRIDGHIVISAI